MYILELLIKNQVSGGVWAYIWVMNYISFINVFVYFYSIIEIEGGGASGNVC